MVGVHKRKGGPLDEAAPERAQRSPQQEHSQEKEAAAEDPPGAEQAPDAISCPGTSGASFTTVPVTGGGLNHPDSEHADLNLALRGYSPTSVAAELVDKDGPGGRRSRRNWPASSPTTAARPLGRPIVSMTGTGTAAIMVVRSARSIRWPPPCLRWPPAQANRWAFRTAVRRFTAAATRHWCSMPSPTRITLGYTRDDSVANGYVVHLENVCVDPEPGGAVPRQQCRGPRLFACPA